MRSHYHDVGPQLQSSLLASLLGVLLTPTVSMHPFPVVLADVALGRARLGERAIVLVRLHAGSEGSIGVGPTAFKARLLISKVQDINETDQSCLKHLRRMSRWG